MIDEVLGLDAVGLELVGHKVIEIIENQVLIHHGINNNYKPSGYTVDSFSNDSTIVGEYSTETGYFDYKGEKDNPIYKKINNDITHAMSHKAPNGPNRIYLISNQEEPPSFRAIFNLTKQATSYGERLVIIDACELAKRVYEQSIANTLVADYYKSFFPTFSQDLDNFEYFGKLPSLCDKHVREADLLHAIESHYKKGESICVLYGVSGSGKSQAAIDFVHYTGNRYQNYIWISGEDWKSNTSLSSVQRTRGGIPVNIAGLFNSAKTILIIDGIERRLERSYFKELLSGFDKGGVVLATSQLSVPGSSLYQAVPKFSRKASLQILGEEPTSNSEICDKFVETCSFSPLILSMTRELSEMEGISRKEIYKEILSMPEVVSDADGTSIIRKILEKLEYREQEALQKIADSGSNSHDIKFLRYFIGINTCSNLQKLSMLMPSNILGVMKIHDLVSIAIRKEHNYSVIASAIESYISEKQGEMTPSVLRQIHLCYEQIYEEHIKRGEREADWLMYALLQCDGASKIAVHENLHVKEITPDLTLAAVMCIIDAKEVHSYTIKSNDERKAYYEQCVLEFEKAFSQTNHNDIQAELLHHRGKALRRCGNYEGALTCFIQLLEFKPDWHAVYGQIAYLGTRHGVTATIKEKGEEAIQYILNAVLRDPSSVPLRVSLSALARLRSYRQVSEQLSTVPDDVKRLADIIAMSALEGLAQFYEAYVSFTSIFGYRYSLYCVALAENFPEMIDIPPNQVDIKQWISACEALTYTAIAAARQEKSEVSSRLISSAIMFAEEICKQVELKPFDARAVAKTYSFGDCPQKAILAIDKVSKSKVDFWL